VDSAAAVIAAVIVIANVALRPLFCSPAPVAPCDTCRRCSVHKRRRDNWHVHAGRSKRTTRANAHSGVLALPAATPTSDIQNMQPLMVRMLMRACVFDGHDV
jgi:hypothetical protein